MSGEELRGPLLALLVVADGPLDITALARTLEAPIEEVEAAARDLMAEPPVGLAVQRLDDEVQLGTAPEMAPYIRRLRGSAEVQRLTRAALEVLAVVAYRQPVTRGDIEAVRGVSSDHALETLLARGLVAEVGRRESVGRPALFATTHEFLRLAGMSSLEELPALPEGGGSGAEPA
ncbi:MAG: SMC-Scp complex subunit ScpB [Chloroflexi bacterium]|nr:SMC-Scp complex subunit ScpB [Chloroflexota bacterium]